MEKTSNLQDRFLNSARKEHAIVTIIPAQPLEGFSM